MGLVKYAIATVLLGTSTISQAVNPEVGVGFSVFDKQANGIWYQEGFPFKINLVSPTLDIGVVGHLVDSVDYRIGYRYLGRVTSDALALSSDEEYDRYKENGKPAEYSDYGHLARWRGFGEVQGIYSSILPKYSVSKDLTLVAEAGVFIYKSTWKMDVSEWQACKVCELQDISVKHKSQIKADWFGGIGVKYGTTTLMVNISPSATRGDEFPAVYGNTVWSVSVRKEF